MAWEKSGPELKTTYIREKRGAFDYPKSDGSQTEAQLDRELGAKFETAKKLALIKKDIINGDLERAKIRLLQTQYSEDFSRPIQYRYLGIIHFIEGDYKRSQEFLTKKELSDFAHQDNICLLRTLNFIILNQAANAEVSWNRCQKFLSGKRNSIVWMRSLLDLKLEQETEKAAAPLEGISVENESVDNMRLFMKLALYLNKQEAIFPRTKYFSLEAFQNPRTRELLGLLYFRDLQIVKAYNLIEDLSTPNSENIKGNILLAQKKYELAYAQFKLALKRKNNSQNALERIAPTAWILNQWEEGAVYASRLEARPGEESSKLTLEAAFLSKAGDHKEAIKKLKTVVTSSNNSEALEVNQLYAYNALATGDLTKAALYSDKACRQQDAFSCWTRQQLLLWEDFSALIKREDKIFDEVDDLVAKYTESFEPDPIKEQVFIDQKAIEELEDIQIELLPEAGPSAN